MGMISDFLFFVEKTRTNINGLLTGKNGEIVSTTIDIAALTDKSDHVPSSAVVNSALDALSSVSNISSSITKNTDILGNTSTIVAYRMGRLVYAVFDINFISAASANDTIASGFPVPIAVVRSFLSNGKKLNIGATGLVTVGESVPTGWAQCTITYLTST